MNKIILFTLLIVPLISIGQVNAYRNDVFIKALYKDSSYLNMKQKIAKKYAHAKPGSWGEFIKGVDEQIVTEKKIVGLTFDACGGRNGNKYDTALINFLHREKIHATLFITGKWIDANYNAFLKLAKDTLFEIENHGLNHQPCSVDGESEYGIKGTASVPDAFDEIEANARKIEKLTGRRPIFYRSATAFTDEACTKIAKELNITVVSFDVLSCDAIENTTKEIIKKEVIKNIRPGAIVIMHFNHPEGFTYKSMVEIIPELRKSGYTFVKLNEYPLLDLHLKKK